LYAVNRYGDKETKLKKIFSGEYIQEYPFEKSKCQFQLSKEDVDILKKELQEQKKKFVKRLETYWKKFGSSKLQTWTYLVD
jgi:AAA+ ATPase superfamily predicted ATPase